MDVKNSKAAMKKYNDVKMQIRGAMCSETKMEKIGNVTEVLENSFDKDGDFIIGFLPELIEHIYEFGKKSGERAFRNKIANL